MEEKANTHTVQSCAAQASNTGRMPIIAAQQMNDLLVSHGGPDP